MLSGRAAILRPGIGYVKMVSRWSRQALTNVGSVWILCGSAPVAQLDRVPGYEPGGRRFESFRARHLQDNGPCNGAVVLCEAGRPPAGGHGAFGKLHCAVTTGCVPWPRSAEDCIDPDTYRSIAQPGRAPALGAGCRGFESLCSDHPLSMAQSCSDCRPWAIRARFASPSVRP